MLPSVFKYSYPNAKIRAMKGSLLTSENFLSLLNAGSYHEFLLIVQTTWYKSVFPEEGGELSLSLFTNSLYKSVFSDYVKVIHAVDGELQRFFILLYQQYELTNLKTILRGLCSRLSTDEILPLLLPTEKYTLFSKQDVLALQDVLEVIDHLQGSFFEYPLNRAIRRFEKEREFFPLEMSLELYYYRTLWDNTEKLPEEERRIVQEILGMLIDILNVSWIIRLKERYHFSPEEILNYTIHHGYAFKLKDRRRLAEARGVSEILTYLQHSPYRKAISGDESIETLHIVLSRFVLSRLQTYFQGQPFQIGVILGYLILKEFEVSDLITIAEAKKYGLSFEQSKQYVIHI